MVDAATLTPERILRRLEWRVLRRLDGRLQGDHRTLLRGVGIDVADLREYQPYDEARHIDWNVTARTDVAHVREYDEDREVTAWLVLDRSSSMAFGPVARRKHLVLTEVAATVAQLVARGGNRVGALLFDAEIERLIPPGQGRNQVLRIVSALLEDQRPDPSAEQASPPTARRSVRFARSRRQPKPPTRQTTDLAVPLRGLLGIAQRRSLIVVVSDFLSQPGWQRPLALLGRRHDVLCLQVVDPREFDLPDVGMIYVEDAETGEQIFVDTGDPIFRRRLRAAASQRQQALVELAHAAGTELFTVATDDDLVRVLIRIAELRRRRRPR